MTTTKPITLNEALEDYGLTRLVNLAPSTHRKTDYQLETFREWVTRETQPYVYLADVDLTIITRYFARLRPPRLSEATFNVYAGSVKRFFKYCVGEGWIRTSPARHLDKLPEPKRVRMHLSAVELQQLLDDADNPRDRIALAAGMHTSLRNQDVAALKIQNVNLYDDVIEAFVDKTGDVMRLPINSEFRDELLRWFDAYAAQLGLENGSALRNDFTLIPSMGSRWRDTGAGFSGRVSVLKPYGQYKNMQEIVHRALAKLGLDAKGEGFHTLRRSSLRLYHDLAAASGDPDPMGVAQTMAGHKSRLTTEKYLGITPETARRDKLIKNKPFLERMIEIAETEKKSERDMPPSTQPLKRRRHA